jgi:hypothetical protein
MPIEISDKQWSHLGIPSNPENWRQEHFMKVNTIRRASRLRLLDGFTPKYEIEGVKIESTNPPHDLLRHIGLFNPKTIGAIRAEEADNGQTTDFVIPVAMEKGPVEFVVNGAWGIMETRTRTSGTLYPIWVPFRYPIQTSNRKF